MAAYVVYQGEITDPERYERYRPLAAAALEAAGGRFLVRGGETEQLEGEQPPSRTVLMEFDSMAAAVAWYNSAAYEEARAVRAGAARARMYVVAGV